MSVVSLFIVVTYGKKALPADGAAARHLSNARGHARPTHAYRLYDCIELPRRASASELNRNWGAASRGQFNAILPNFSTRSRPNRPGFLLCQELIISITCSYPFGNHALLSGWRTGSGRTNRNGSNFALWTNRNGSNFALCTRNRGSPEKPPAHTSECGTPNPEPARARPAAPPVRNSQLPTLNSKLKTSLR